MRPLWATSFCALSSSMPSLHHQFLLLASVLPATFTRQFLGSSDSRCSTLFPQQHRNAPGERYAFAACTSVLFSKEQYLLDSRRRVVDKFVCEESASSIESSSPTPSAASVHTKWSPLCEYIDKFAHLLTQPHLPIVLSIDCKLPTSQFIPLSRIRMFRCSCPAYLAVF